MTSRSPRGSTPRRIWWTAALAGAGRAEELAHGGGPFREAGLASWIIERKIESLRR